MKFLFLATSLLALCSCAVGSTADLTAEPVEVTVPPHKAPAPQAPPEPVETQTDPQCVINTSWVNDCFVVDIECKDKPPHIEVSCGPGRPLWPWEIIPDPPYDNRNRK
jgi:hypothetical protein